MDEIEREETYASEGELMEAFSNLYQPQLSGVLDSVIRSMAVLQEEDLRIWQDDERWSQSLTVHYGTYLKSIRHLTVLFAKSLFLMRFVTLIAEDEDGHSYSASLISKSSFASKEIIQLSLQNAILTLSTSKQFCNVEQ